MLYRDYFTTAFAGAVGVADDVHAGAGIAVDAAAAEVVDAAYGAVAVGGDAGDACRGGSLDWDGELYAMTFDDDCVVDFLGGVGVLYREDALVIAACHGGGDAFRCAYGELAAVVVAAESDMCGAVAVGEGYASSLAVVSQGYSASRPMAKAPRLRSTYSPFSLYTIGLRFQ